MTETRDDSSNLPAHRLWQPTTAKWFAVVFGVALGYSIVRYHLAGDVPWNHFPLFILNKATSLAAVVFVACSYLIGPRRLIRWHSDAQLRLVVIKFCGLMGFSLAAIHALFSFCLIEPAYFPKYFLEDGRLNLMGEMGLATGVIGLWALTMPALTTLPMMPKAIGGVRWKRSQRMGYLCLTLIVVHLVFLGWKGWLAPGRVLQDLQKSSQPGRTWLLLERPPPLPSVEPAPRWIFPPRGPGTHRMRLSERRPHQQKSSQPARTSLVPSRPPPPPFVEPAPPWILPPREPGTHPLKLSERRPHQQRSSQPERT